MTMRYVMIIVVVICLLIVMSVALTVASAGIHAKQVAKDDIKPTSTENSTTDKTQTPPWWVYVTAWIAVLNFLFTVGFSVYKLKKTRSASIRDKYWFREILLPICIDPLHAFANDQASQLKVLENRAPPAGESDELRKKLYKEYLMKFRDQKNDVINRFMVLLPIQKDIYDVVAKKLDELEDSVTSYCANKTFGSEMGAVSHPGQVIFSSLGEVMVAISEKHTKLF